jgi:RNA polymerase sigma-70 factor (ECF subfamily)
MARVDDLDPSNLDRYYLFHAIRADLLRRLGRRAEADAAYDTAIARTGNAAERAYLALAKQHLAQPDGVAEGERHARGDHRPGS